jgi:predicted TIM-barrel fold metal-dependent hydrolase
VRAYNDWLSEYCAHAPDRLAGIALVPNRGVGQAVAEVERVAALPGIVGGVIGCYPHGDLDLAVEDDAVWHALVDVGFPLHIHVGMSDGLPNFQSSKLPGDVRFYDAPKRILQFIWSGALDRVPELEIVVAEVDAGWIPYFKEQVDDRFRRLGRGAGLALSALPSEYIEHYFYFTYITDHVGVRARHEVGIERMMWSSDYPHVGSDWPNSWRTIAADYSGIAPAERELMLAGNAARLYGLDARSGRWA